LLNLLDKKGLIELKSNAGKNGLTFWTQNSTKATGLTLNYKSFMKSTIRWAPSGALSKNILAGSFLHDLEPKTRSKTGSMAP